MRALLLLAGLAGFLLAVLLAWGFAPELAFATEPVPPAEVVALRSQNASLEAALYVAERQACPNLGVYPVPPPSKGARR